MTPNTVTEQLTAAGRAIEHDSFAIIDAEVGHHAYTAEQWPIVRRMIHANADFEFNGLAAFHPDAVEAGLRAILAGATAVVADVEMICVGLSKSRLAHFGLHTHEFISDIDVIEAARAAATTRAVQAMRKAHRHGLLDGAIVGIGNAPTALIELLRLIRDEGVRPALVIGMPVGFVSAAESKALLAGLIAVPWITIRGRKGGSTLVVAALHALLGLAEARQHQAARRPTPPMLPAPPPKVRKGDRRRQRGNRTGFTTGATAAAAATAATLGLVRGTVPTQVECELPNGMRVSIAILDGRLEHVDGLERAHAVAIKDGGDDPDATHGARITVDVFRIPHGKPEVVLEGGPGVGTVTRPGLGLALGEAAINPVPRRNIAANVAVAGAPILQAGDGLTVRISVPGGEEMAKKTLNARLGILGGISILGTTGIVRPFSTAAWRASVVQAIEVAAAQGQSTVVLTTGGRTEKCAMRSFPQLDEACFVQFGDFVKAAFTSALRHGMRHIVLGAMVGKLTKIAQGLSVTHAWREEVDRALIADTALEIGAPASLVAEIGAAETARFAAERLAELGLAIAFHRALAARAIRSLRDRYPGPYRLTVLACNFEGEAIVSVDDDAPALRPATPAC